MPILEAVAVIRAKDETAAAFAAVEARIKELSKTVSSIGMASGSTGRAVHDTSAITREVGAATAATDNLAASMGRVHEHVTRAHKAVGGLRESLSQMKDTFGPVIGVGAAIAGYEGAKYIVEGNFARQHERVRMAAAGMKPGEIGDAEIAAAQLGAKYGPVSNTDIMHLLRNTRSIVGSYGAAKDIVDPLLALRVVATGAHPGEEMEQDFDKLVKGLEIKGVTQNPAKFRAYIDAMGRSINAFGDTLRPTDFYEMFKYGRQATQNLSLDYMASVAPKLMQEMGGASAGVAQQAFYTAIVGGHMAKTALARLEEFDLVDKSKVVSPKGGHLANAAGAIQDWQLASINPYEWVNQVLLPAMAKKGIVDPAKIQEVISSMFSKSTAAQLVSILATQQEIIEKDTAIQRGTMSTDAAAHAFMTDDPTIASKSVANALENLSLEVFGGSKNVAHGLAGLADSINRFVADVETERAREDALRHAPFDPEDIRSQSKTAQDRSDELRKQIGLLDPATAPATLAALQARQAQIYGDMDKGKGDFFAQHRELEDIRTKIGILQGGAPAFAAATTELQGLDAADVDRMTLYNQSRWLTRDRAAARAARARMPGRWDGGGFNFSEGYRGPGAPYMPGGLASSLSFGVLGSPSGPLPYGAPGVSDPIERMLSQQRLSEITRETSRGNALSNLPTDLKVSLDPNSKVDVTVQVHAVADGILKIIADAVAAASGSARASVGTSSAGISPNGPGGIGRR